MAEVLRGIANVITMLIVLLLVAPFAYKLISNGLRNRRQ